MGQPATSGGLARLRDFFKDDLLFPVGRKMVLTSLADELAPPLRKILLKAEAIIHHRRGFAHRTFRLLMPDYVATVLMSRGLPEISTKK